MAKTGLVILAGLSGFSLVGNEMTVMAQEGIAPDGPAQLATLSTTNPGEGTAPDSPGAPTATTNPGEGIAPDGPAQLSSFFSSQSAASAASLSSAGASSSLVTLTDASNSGPNPSSFIQTAALSSSSANAVTVTASAVTVTGAVTVTASPVTVTANLSTVTGSPVTVTASSTAVQVSSSTAMAMSSSIVTSSVTTMTAPAVTVPASTDAAAELYSLAAQQSVVTQAPCVSACLQPAVIASAAGECGRSLGLSIDNGCGCVSAPLMVMQALTNCASAACTGGAAGTMNPAAGPVAVSSLYLEYCVTAVGANVFASASASEASRLGMSSASSPEDSASQTMTSVPTVASAGMTMPGFTNGNTTFNTINPTVTATTVITATTTEASSSTTGAGDPAGNNTGSKSDGVRTASGHLAM
jgi:hypothetical protein